MTTWPDGSLKFAVLSGTAALTAGSATTITLSKGTSTTGTALTTANLKATGITASIACGSFGTVSWSGTDWDSSFAAHVSGPQMSSWIYRKPVGADAHLVAWLEVRLFASGAVEVLPWIENGYIKVAHPTNKAATYVFTLGGTQRSSQAIDLPARCRTPLVAGQALSYWLDTDPGVVVRHDTDYLQGTEVVPPYMATVDPSSSMVTSLPATFTPLQQGSFAYSQDAMESTGFANPIGLLPQHDVLYLTSNAPSIYASVIRNGYSAGRYPIHYRDEATNRPLKFSDHPNLSSNSSSTNDYTAVASGTVPPDWDQAHHPSVGFMAYLLTGRYYFIDEVQFAATANYVGLNDVVRGGVLGYTVPVEGVNQVRQAAWNTRTLMTACAITPNADTAMHAEYATAFTNTITKYYNQYVAQPNNPLGFIQSDPDYTGNLSGAQAAAATGFMAPTWQHDFFTATIGWALAAGLPITSTAQTQLAGVFTFVAKSVVGRLGATNTGTDYLFTEAGAYFVCAAASHTPDWAGGTGPWLANWNEAYEITKKVMSYYVAPAIFTESTTTLHEISTPPAGGYFANLLPAIAYAVRHNAKDADLAYARLTGATGWSDMLDSLNDYSPVWGVRPLN
ncbi:hypothetical protein [Scleromatobacter humisilvae]|uniref:Uncharacterized protein n=1 Tax=Scleromatobacter humisilvae TaxID=2897159 RepID=A0A9X1YK68_9BURK|nr:hypothetical protein [Scleromatobacter humisilvae]MCK9686353.1 hypothetical protein [Scleromatobacter humisilvae]